MKPRLSPMPEEDPRRWNIVRGDLVEVIQGHSLGQKGKVLSVIRDSARIVVDGVNMVKLWSLFSRGCQLLSHNRCLLDYSEAEILNLNRMERPVKRS